MTSLCPTRSHLAAALAATFVALPALSTAAAAAEATLQFQPNVPAKAVSDTFDFEFYGTNVKAWADGDRSGLIGDHKGTMASALEGLIKSTKRSLRLAAYGVQQQSWIFAALKDLVERDVGVGAVVDQVAGQVGQWTAGNFTYPNTIRLPKAVGDGTVTVDQGPTGNVRTSTIMHNKFAVVDRAAVWMGSANLSSTCMGDEYNANTALLVRSPELARIYADEYDQMHDSRRFSTSKLPRADRAPLRYEDGTEVRVYFSPQDNTLTGAILPFLSKATETLDIGMFYLTDQSVAEAIVNARSRGVKVRVIYDAVAAAHPASLHGFLREHGIELRVENWGGKMHMKDAVADGRHVLMGSMNWSDSGNGANDENTLVVRNNARLGKAMQAYFQELWDTLPAAGKDPRSESYASKNSCVDGVDNDHDGLTDDEDTGCD
jgi:phosphatidylserine/phosphatidylglycerophosphate/cardiolipin synthase-like enzyme